jgi:HEAT repeat protein
MRSNKEKMLMTIQETIKTDPQGLRQYAQKLVSRFANRESWGETAEDLVLEIIGEGKGRKGKPTKRQLKLAARCLVTTLLHDPDYRRRAIAIRMIDELPLLLGVERALIKALRDSAVLVRGYAARAIWKLKCTKAVQPLLDLLTGEESDKARIHATRTEERIGCYSPDEYNWLDYAFAIKALGILGDQQAVEPLLAYLRRLPPYIFDPEAFRRSLESPPTFSWEPPDKPVWHKSIIRVRLIDALGKLRDPRATETLCEFLADSDGHISCAAAHALKEIQDRRAIDPLINMLASCNHIDLHKEIHGALLTFAGDELVEKLIAALPTDSKQILRSGIIPILGDLQATQTIELLLVRLSTEENPELRQSLALTLGKLGASQAKEPLYLLLQQFDGIPEPKERYDTTNQRLYSALFFALAQLGDSRILDILLQVIHHKDSIIQSYAIDGLIVLDPQLAGEVLISHLRDWKPEDSGTSFELTGIINNLTELEDKRAGEPLRELLATLADRQKYRFDRYKIIRALGKLGDQSAVEPLMTVFQQGPVPEPASPYISDKEDNLTEAEYSAEALGNLGDPQASQLLISYLKNHSQIRWDLASYVIEALGKLGDPAALPEIKWALHFASNKILALSPKARGRYRIYKIKNKALTAISHITKTPLQEELVEEVDYEFDRDDI